MAIDCRCGKKQHMKCYIPAAVSSAMASEASKNGQRWTKRTIGNFAGKDLWVGRCVGISLEGYTVQKYCRNLGIGISYLPRYHSLQPRIRNMSY